MSTPFQNRLNELLQGKYSDRIPELDEKVKRGKTLSNLDIAKVISTSKQVVGHWVNGASPKIEMLVRLAQAYKISVDWLLGIDDAANHIEQQAYAPFKSLGFSYKAYCNLLKIKEQNPQKYQEYMKALNIILEQENDTIGYESDMKTPSKYPTNSVLDILANFFRKKFPTTNCWITATPPEQLIDMMTVQIKENYDTSHYVPDISAYHAVCEKLKPCETEMYDAYLFSILTQELKWIREDYYHSQSEK